MSWTIEQEATLRSLCVQFWPRGNWSDANWDLILRRCTKYPSWAVEAALKDIRGYQKNQNTPTPSDIVDKSDYIFGLFLKQKKKQETEIRDNYLTPQEFARDMNFWGPRIASPDKNLGQWYYRTRLAMLGGELPKVGRVREPGEDEPDDGQDDTARTDPRSHQETPETESPRRHAGAGVGTKDLSCILRAPRLQSPAR